jgi:hypothetical protein
MIQQPIQRHDKLNPKLWDNDNNLKPEIKHALLKIAQDFIDFVGIKFPIWDIEITGGNANYTYTEHSDIDLHIITEFDKIDCQRTVEELFDSKQALYKRRYDITIKDIPVELYVQGRDETLASRGIYSLKDDRWISEPSLDIPEYDEAELDHMVKVWQSIIHHAEKTQDPKTIHKSRQLLKQYRTKGLRTDDSEFSIPNLVFKALRNSGDIGKLMDMMDQLHDQQLSLTQENVMFEAAEVKQVKPKAKKKTFAPPKKTITAYKLFKQKGGQLYPLFIGKNTPTPIGQWIPATHIPTKGFAERPGWHAGVLPMAPHLRTKANKIASDRVWAEVEIPADVDWQDRADQTRTRDIRDQVPDNGFYRFKTNKMQGGAWIIGGALKIDRILTDDEVSDILKNAGYPEDAEAERHD